MYMYIYIYIVISLSLSLSIYIYIHMYIYIWLSLFRRYEITKSAVRFQVSGRSAPSSAPRIGDR